MIKSQPVAKDVDSYIKTQPKPIRGMLVEMRQAIKSVAPKAEESISYMMPAYKQDGVLVYFAGCKNHIGFYPTGSGVKAFEKELSGYKFSKGAIQFPLDQPLPLALVKRMVKFRLEKNKVAARLKETLKKEKKKK